MSWELKKIDAGHKKNEVFVTSFFGGEHDKRCLQLTQVAGEGSGIEGSTQFVQLSRAQLLELVKRINDWDSGAVSEYDPHGTGIFPEDD